MKLIVFIKRDNKENSEQTDLILKLTRGNLLDGLTNEQRNDIAEDIQSMISSIPIDKQIEGKGHSPIMINLYRIKEYPTIIFTNGGELIYRWDKRVPTIEEIVTSIKNYIKILKLEEMDYNYDPEE